MSCHPGQNHVTSPEPYRHVKGQSHDDEGDSYVILQWHPPARDVRLA